MNLVFHVAAAAAFIVLVYLLLRQKSSHDFTLELLKIARQTSTGVQQRIFVETPGGFLTRCGRAFSVPFEGLADARSASRSWQNPRRIDPAPWAELFADACVVSLRFAADRLEVRLREIAHRMPQQMLREHEATLERSLGDDIRIVVVREGEL